MYFKKIVIIDRGAFFNYKFYDRLVFILTLAFLNNILIHVFSYVTEDYGPTKFYQTFPDKFYKCFINSSKTLKK